MTEENDSLTQQLNTMKTRTHIIENEDREKKDIIQMMQFDIQQTERTIYDLQASLAANEKYAGKQRYCPCGITVVVVYMTYIYNVDNFLQHMVISIKLFYLILKPTNMTLHFMLDNFLTNFKSEFGNYHS